MFIYSEQQITATWVCVCVSAYVYITLRKSYTLLTYQQQQPHHRGPWIDDWKIHVSRVLLLYWCRHHFLHFILNEKVVKKQKEQTREKEGAPLSPVLDVDFRPPRPQLGSSGGTKTTTGWPSHRHFFFVLLRKKKNSFFFLLFPNKSVTIHARSEHVREKSFCCCFSSSIKQTCSFEKLTSRWWWGSTGECSLFPTLSREKRRRTSYPGLDLFCCCFSPGLPVSHDSQLSA